jgi:hypothetical protein
MPSSTHAHIAAQAPLKYAVRPAARRHAGLSHQKKGGDNEELEQVNNTYEREREGGGQGGRLDVLDVQQRRLGGLEPMHRADRRGESEEIRDE